MRYVPVLLTLSLLTLSLFSCAAPSAESPAADARATDEPSDTGESGGTDARAEVDAASDVAVTADAAEILEDVAATDEGWADEDALGDMAEPDAEPADVGAPDAPDAPDVEEPAPWQVLGGVIYHDGKPAQIRGVNWFGMETADNAPHGLWTGRTIAEFVVQIADLGFNAVRLPVNPGSIRPGVAAATWAQSAGFPTGREALEAVLSEAETIGLWVLLDFHSCDDQHGENQVGAPDGCDGATIEQWHSDLETLAQLGLEHPNVIGIDLFNEPWGLTWAQWADLASVASDVVLNANPDLLVFVQGVANESDNAGFSSLWGGNMTEAAKVVPDIPADRMVYSPHVYGPSVSPMDYFHGADYPQNLPKIWQAHFAHLHSAGYAVITGEFGSRYDNEEIPGSVAWQDAWIAFMVATGQTDFFYWALNGNTGQIAGILQDDWLTPDPKVMAALSPLLKE